MARAGRMRFTILGEGMTDYYFVKAFLEAALGRRNVQCFRAQTIPGAGSGEQQVRELFAKELAARRSRPHGERHWLVVITDGDRSTPSQRREQLEKAAEAQQLHRPVADEKVAVFVPCRNIEAWLQWLETGVIDETMDYKKRFSNAKPTKYATQLRSTCQHLALDNFPPSLQDACQQWHNMNVH